MARLMKDSGIEWIGEIPAEWESKKLKYVSDFIQNKYEDSYGALPYIGLENIVAWNGAYIQTDSQYDRDQSLICEPNDILFGKLRPYLAKVYMNPALQCCSGEFAVIRIVEQHTRYMWYQMMSHGFIFTVDRSTYGTKMPRANADFIKDIPIAIPPIAEQHRIAAYLDCKCAEIDAVIERTKATIEEYKKLKQAVITEAVTKGVRGARKMKDSGIEWIGEIPEEWRTVPLKAFIDILPGYAFSSDDFSTENGIPLLRGINVAPNIIRWDETVRYNLPITEQLTLFQLQEGDIVVGLDRPWISDGTRIAWVTKDDVPSLLLQRVCRIRAKEGIDLRWVYHWIASNAFQESLSTETTGVSVPHISTKQIGNFVITLPSYEEQNEVCNYLDEKCAALDRLIAKKTALLTELETYKKSLIYEYVTGKKEVE